MRSPVIIIFLLFFGLLGACSLLNGEKKDDCIEENETCGGIKFPTPVYPQPYAQPTVSPDGRKLIFVRNKITRLNAVGGFSIDSDSSGIWTADLDGSNMTLLLKGQNLGSPSFSPDMEWILFEAGAQIYKVPFEKGSIDTTGFVQLTDTGRNFFPDWSPDGHWVVYDRSIEDETGPSGIWVMKQNGEEKEPVFGGAFPDWHPDGGQIIGTIGTSPTSVWKRFKIYTLEDGATEILDAVVDGNNLYPRYSLNGNQIVFQSDAQIWIMDEDGNNLFQLTFEGGVEAAWYLDGKIVYVQYNYSRYVKSNGTLWIMNADGSGKKQLTYNYGLELE